MYRFIYLNKRPFSTNINIKTLFPKCDNCLNFNSKNKTCKKFIYKSNNNTNYNYILNEYAKNIRNDDTKCGETGKLFEHNYLELVKQNEKDLSYFIIIGNMLGAASIFIPSNYYYYFLSTFSIPFYYLSKSIFTYNYINRLNEEDNERIKKLKEINDSAIKKIK
jgi:hypothetical protein